MQLLNRFFDAISAFQIGRHGHVDLLGIGQVKIGHDLLEFGKRNIVIQAGIACAFLHDRRNAATRIIMSWIDQRVFREGEQLFADRPVKGFGIAVLEIGAAAAIDQQRVT